MEENMPNLPELPSLEGIGMDSPKPPRHEALAFLWETIKVVVISMAIIVPVRYFLVQPFFVKGASMEPTFQDGNYILIDELSYDFREPIRGDVVVFRFPEDRSQFFIKRIIGLPGETVEVKNNMVKVYNQEHPQGQVLKEPYLDRNQITAGNMKTVLDPNEYFVLGDNRLRSSDSRIWGTVNRSLIIGRVFFRALPFDEFGKIPPPSY
jgi:signal peptidase I